MAKWQPESERPIPDPWFVRELKKIDPDLRVVWGMERYLRAEWAIERKTPAERYFLMYESILSDNGPRFVEQPIFDASKPIKDEYGEVVSYEQVGTRMYDLAPEYEWIAFRPTLDSELLTLIKKLYWENAHQKETAAENAAADAAKDEAKTAKRIAAGVEGIEEALLDTRKKVQFGHGQTRKETEFIDKYSDN